LLHIYSHMSPRIFSASAGWFSVLAIVICFAILSPFSVLFYIYWGEGCIGRIITGPVLSVCIFWSLLHIHIKTQLTPCTKFWRSLLSRPILPRACSSSAKERNPNMNISVSQLPTSQSIVAMNSVQDPSKKTSITSLLNPEASSVAFTSSIPASLNPNQVSPHVPQIDVYGTSFANGSSFNLRAADWNMADDASKHSAENGARLYQHIRHDAYIESSSTHPPRMAARSRVDEPSHYTMAGSQAIWHPPQDPASMPYGAPVVAPLYSDERTG
jgi:hypothetical protein